MFQSTCPKNASPWSLRVEPQMISGGSSWGPQHAMVCGALSRLRYVRSRCARSSAMRRAAPSLAVEATADYETQGAVRFRDREVNRACRGEPVSDTRRPRPAQGAGLLRARCARVGRLLDHRRRKSEIAYSLQQLEHGQTPKSRLYVVSISSRASGSPTLVQSRSN